MTTNLKNRKAEYMRQCCAENKDKLRLARKKYYETHKDKVAEINRMYKNNNPDRIKHINRESRRRINTNQREFARLSGILLE